jgi:RNA polymerase sigma factor (sigma-70 family)
MMSVESFGVDAPFVDGTVTPFVSESSKIFSNVQKELFRKLSSRSLLQGAPTPCGPEKGRLNRLHAEFVASPTTENLNLLLAEVEIYARRITLRKGGAFSKYLHQSATNQYSVSEVSSEVVIKIWQNLPKFDGRSKFSGWVFRIARNVVKDKCRAIINRRERMHFDWKGYEHLKHVDDYLVGRGRASRAASGKSANGELEIVSRSKTSLPCGGAPDERVVKLEKLIEGLSPQDKELVELVLHSNYTPRELGDKFGRNAKWASNQLNRIKKTLKKLAKECYPAVEVAKTRSSGVLVMKGDQASPASQAAD